MCIESTLHTELAIAFMEVTIFTFQKDVSSLSFVIHEKRFNYPMLLILSNKTREADFTIRVEKPPSLYHFT